MFHLNLIKLSGKISYTFHFKYLVGLPKIFFFGCFKNFVRLRKNLECLERFATEWHCSVFLISSIKLNSFICFFLFRVESSKKQLTRCLFFFPVSVSTRDTTFFFLHLALNCRARMTSLTTYCRRFHFGNHRADITGHQI